LIDACRRIRERLDQGAPWDACDVFREEITRSPRDAELLYWGALAHARAGAGHAAHGLLDQAQAVPGLAATRLADILSVRGRLLKDTYQRAPERASAMQCLVRARDQYARAFALTNDAYPGINAATLSLLIGDRDAALPLARALATRLAAQTTNASLWDKATEGEARLLLGDIEGAAQSYASAWQSAAGHAGSVATMRRQVSLLARVIPAAIDILQLLRVCDVVAFAGHMTDAPARPVARFPMSLVGTVAAAIREHVASLHAPIVYTSVACGADLLFAEAARERGAEVNVVLPFDKEDFVRTSVAVGGDAWIARFDAALASAAHVIMATEEGYLGDDVLFEHASVLVEGFSMLRAAQLQTTPSLLCVLDAGEIARVGGTRATVERWRRNVGEPHVIDLASLRAGLADVGAAVGDRDDAPGPVLRRAAVAVPAVAAAPVPPAPVDGQRPRRTLKTMLFADFAGYSRLHDAFAPLFQQRFLAIGAALIDASVVKPLEAKTWGDAIYAVFDAPCDGARFALDFLDRMLEVDWTAAGLSESSQIRIALHAGPVFCAFDPVMRNDSHFGSSVTRAARIEPVTPPGMVYASEAFAATLASTGQTDYAFEYVGRLALAKGYGESRIYRLDRR
jgi:hypothetical protein